MMEYEIDHPNVTLPQWWAFRARHRRVGLFPPLSNLIDEVIERYETRLPDEYVR